MNQVAILHGTDVIKTLEATFNKIGGIKQYFREGLTVFIKPDLDLPLGHPVTIQSQILGYIIRSCRDLGAKEVYIGFNPFDGVSSKQVFKLLGLDYYLQKSGGTLLSLEDETYSNITISDPIYFKTLQIPDKLLQSDIFVSLVAPRTDVFGQLSLGLKNYFGLLNDEQKQQLLQSGSLIGLLDFFKIRPPQLTIWDALFVGEGQGPFNQKAIPYNLILASTDLLAGDSIMTHLMGIDPFKEELLKIASSNQLGIIDPNQIPILGEKLAAHQKIIQKPVISSKNVSEWFDVIEGEPCPGCQIGLRYFLDFLFRFIEKDIKEFGGFTCFIGKLPSDLTYSLKTGVILFGNCAIFSNLNLKFTSKIQKREYFFKFPGCPPLNLRSIENFCLDFKEWLPSLEIIEEFIRKWTIGRRLQSYRPISLKE
ncbi:MAG: DUF362 domain-containing protein [Candidatus Helarchaeota archaeon]|nr:DUF362 domain-containing protein [Candidatus Helarchaeota archaeon]